MSNEETSQNESSRLSVDSFAKFLEEVPPGEFRDLPKGTFTLQPSGNYSFEWPAIQLYCANDTCGGLRYADSDSSSITFGPRDRYDRFTHYRCRNCKSHLKFFAVIIFAPDANHAGTAVK